MSLAVERASLFTADFENQFSWYLDRAGADIAWRFQVALDVSLVRLAKQPDLGRLRKFRHPKLRDLHSYRVEPPFAKLLIFYRLEGDTLQAVRLMHGARDFATPTDRAAGFTLNWVGRRRWRGQLRRSYGALVDFR